MALRSRNQNPISQYNKPAREEAPVRNSQGTHRKSLRIVDILEDEPEDCAFDRSMEREDHAVVYCSSPRRIMARWISGLKKRKLKNAYAEPTKGGDQRWRDGDSHAVKLDEIDAPQGASSAIVKSGSGRKSHSFTLGVGCGLLYLVAAGRSELSKIYETKAQMEELLRTVKDDSRVKNASSSCTNSSVENLNRSELCSSSHVVHELPSTSTSSRSLVNVEHKSKGDIDELEAELECELARLDIHLEGGAFYVPKIHETDEERASSKSRSFWGNGEVIDCQEGSGGVCPYELERKLHNILEERQGDRIRELEAELQHLKKELLEKEIELALWKDTAKMISNGTPEPLKLVDSPSNLTPCISFNFG